jgi:gliding motility-associated-like protein
MSTITIEVRQAKEIHAVAVPQGSCAPVEVIFNTSSVTDDPGSEAIWNVGDGSAPLKGTTVTHIYTTPGTYKVQLDYTDGVCKSNPDYIPEIVVHEIPKADFSVPDEVLISNPRVQLINLTTPVGNNSYDWTVSSVGESHDVNPNFEFKKIGKYQIRMVATSLANCVSEISKTIEVKNVFNIFMPNSFTPNYDGLNDFFKPEFTDYGLDVKSFEMEVFDRWGERVYHTRDIYKGWDGTLMNKGDVILKKDVYTYKLKYKDLDGNVFTKTGFVTLQ